MKVKIERKGRVVMVYHMINNVWKLVKVTCGLLIMLGMSSCGSNPAFASQINDKSAILTIIGEEENNYVGMQYVASTIRNRHSLKGCYGLHSLRVTNHLYSKLSYNKAVQAWNWSKSHNLLCSYWFSDQDLRQAKVQRIIRLEHLVWVNRVGSKRFGNNFYKKG